MSNPCFSHQCDGQNAETTMPVEAEDPYSPNLLGQALRRIVDNSSGKSVKQAIGVAEKTLSDWQKGLRVPTAAGLLSVVRATRKLPADIVAPKDKALIQEAWIHREMESRGKGTAASEPFMITIHLMVSHGEQFEPAIQEAMRRK